MPCRPRLGCLSITIPQPPRRTGVQRPHQRPRPRAPPALQPMHKLSCLRLAAPRLRAACSAQPQCRLLSQRTEAYRAPRETRPRQGELRFPPTPAEGATPTWTPAAHCKVARGCRWRRPGSPRPQPSLRGQSVGWALPPLGPSLLVVPANGKIKTQDQTKFKHKVFLCPLVSSVHCVSALTRPPQGQTYLLSHKGQLFSF